MIDYLILGNGSVAFSVAYNLKKKNPTSQILLVGSGKGASYAAGGMLNIYSEIDHLTTFQYKEYKEKFEFSLRSRDYWPSLCADLNIDLHLGTVMTNSTYASEYDDKNYEAIIAALDTYGEEHLECHPDRFGLKPLPNFRSKQVLYLTNEGWVNPKQLLVAYEDWFRKNDVQYISEDCIEALHKYDYRNLIVAVGAYTDTVLSHLNIKLNQKISFGSGVALEIYNPNLNVQKVVRSTNRTNSCGSTIIPRGNGYYYIGASYALQEAPEKPFTLSNIYYITDQLTKEVHSDIINSQVTEIFYGHRPISEDGFPLIGRLSDSISVVTGTKRDGLFMSPLIGDLLTDDLLHGTNSFPQTFNPQRLPLKIISDENQLAIAGKYQEAYTLTHKLS